VYTRERKHIGPIWSTITCLATPLAAQSPARRTLGGSRSCQRLTLQETQERSSVITDEHTFITDEYMLYSSVNRGI
jgi:hypothetical protein